MDVLFAGTSSHIGKWWLEDIVKRTSEREAESICFLQTGFFCACVLMGVCHTIDLTSVTEQHGSIRKCSLAHLRKCSSMPKNGFTSFCTAGHANGSIGLLKISLPDHSPPAVQCGKPSEPSTSTTRLWKHFCYSTSSA